MPAASAFIVLNPEGRGGHPPEAVCVARARSSRSVRRELNQLWMELHQRHPPPLRRRRIVHAAAARHAVARLHAAACMCALTPWWASLLAPPAHVACPLVLPLTGDKARSAGPQAFCALGQQDSTAPPDQAGRPHHCRHTACPRRGAGGAWPLMNKPGGGWERQAVSPFRRADTMQFLSA